MLYMLSNTNTLIMINEKKIVCAVTDTRSPPRRLHPRTRTYWRRRQRPHSYFFGAVAPRDRLIRVKDINPRGRARAHRAGRACV